MKNIRILQTPVRFHPYIGGVENHVLYLSKEMIKLGHKVKVISADEPSSKIKNIFEIEIKRLNYWFKITNTNITPCLPIEILRSKYDIVHTHMPTPWTSDWSIILAKIMGKKSIITIHNDMDKTSLLSKIITEIYLHTIFLLSLSLVNKIILVNEDWEKSFSNTSNILKRYKNKISVLPNGVDSELFKPLHLTKDKNSILFVSILDEHHKFKGLDYLLEAIKLVKKTIPAIRLIVAGEGELKKSYIDKAKDLDILENVEFIGAKKQKDLVKLYNKSSVFVLPSTEIEGFGIVAIEAMACKTPIIVTDIVGVSTEVKQNNCGIIVKSRNINTLTEAIIRTIRNSNIAKSMGENGRKLIEKNYSWKIIAKGIENIYRGTI